MEILGGKENCILFIDLYSNRHMELSLLDSMCCTDAIFVYVLVCRIYLAALLEITLRI